jgi:release factor glutamine methyltransferase
VSATRHAVSLRDALDGARTAIAAGGSPSASLDAELLLCDLLGIDRAELRRDPDAPLPGELVRPYQSRVRRRAVEREPVAYILGRRAFRRIVLDVDPSVLIPRPETELLVELGLELPHGAAVLDCATGSGAVALALADERPDLRVSGSDISEAALAVARRNGERLGLAVRWSRADLLVGIEQRFDAILANPPYIERSALTALEPEVARHEPALALDGGPDGLELIRRLLAQAGRSQAALLAVEHGEQQGQAVAQLARSAGFTQCEHRRDLAGVERVLLARR